MTSINILSIAREVQAPRVHGSDGSSKKDEGNKEKEVIEDEIVPMADDLSPTATQRKKHGIDISLVDFTGKGTWKGEGQAQSRPRQGRSALSPSTSESDEDHTRYISEHYSAALSGYGGDEPCSVEKQKLLEMSALPSLDVINFLFIDDSKVQRRLAERVLSGPLGCEVWNVNSFESGEQALSHVSKLQQHPDVLIVDQNLQSAGGRLFGNEIVAQLKAQGDWQKTVIIGITAEGQDARAAFEAAGCDLVWTKPMPEKFEIQAALHTIQKKRLMNSMDAATVVEEESTEADVGCLTEQLNIHKGSDNVEKEGG